jgi:hypothetical protein
LSFCFLSKNARNTTYRNVISPVVLYWHRNWCVTFRKEHRLRMFKNRVMRKMLGPRKEEVAED